MKLSVDCVVIGGGIAGLFLLARLRKAGYSAVLLENQALGSGQTVCSQGMIHGGMKYALQGFLSPSARAISKMPETWRGFLSDNDGITIPSDCLLANSQTLFSSGKLTSKITNFFGAKALASHVQSVDRKDFPLLLQDKSYEGSVYQLQELVFDVPKVLSHFKNEYANALIKIAKKEFTFQKCDEGSLESITATLDDGSQLTIAANQYFFTAGEGNFQFLNLIPQVKMQKRPLRMVMAKAPALPTLYGHAMMGGVNPEVTISTHYDAEKNPIWYIGGQLAESGINRDEASQALETKNMLMKLFPWMNWDKLSVASFMVNRAERQEPNGARPETISYEQFGNVTLAWPTKLAFSPMLADSLLKNIKIKKQFEMPVLNCAVPLVAKAPWHDESIEWRAV